MKTLALIFILAATLSPHCQAREVRILDLKELIAGSELVLVGKVRSVKQSGIINQFSYPTWEGHKFEWLKVEVEVVEPIKGTKKGEFVRTLMLSIQGPAPIFNSPGMVEPKVGQHHLLCLLPTTSKGVYASLTAPFDDDQAIFLLDRTHWRYRNYRENPKSFDHLSTYRERYQTIWSLVDDQGRITPEGAQELRTKYSTEIKTTPPKDAVIHLKWKTHTGQGGWQWSVPDQETAGAEKKKRPGAPSSGPVSRP